MTTALDSEIVIGISATLFEVRDGSRRGISVSVEECDDGLEAVIITNGDSGTASYRFSGDLWRLFKIFCRNARG